jgi:hypothetical protein
MEQRGIGSDGRPVPAEPAGQPFVNRFLDSAADAASFLGRDVRPFLAFGVAGLAVGSTVVVATALWRPRRIWVSRTGCARSLSAMLVPLLQRRRSILGARSTPVCRRKSSWARWTTCCRRECALAVSSRQESGPAGSLLEPSGQ